MSDGKKQLVRSMTLHSCLAAGSQLWLQRGRLGAPSSVVHWRSVFPVESCTGLGTWPSSLER
eukprot:807568-Amphidinium_carterae.2